MELEGLTQKIEKARLVYQSAPTIGRDGLVTALTRRGDYYLQQGQKDLAVADYLEARTIVVSSPSHTAVDEMDDFFSELEKDPAEITYKIEQIQDLPQSSQQHNEEIVAAGSKRSRSRNKNGRNQTETNSPKFRQFEEQEKTIPDQRNLLRQSKSPKPHFFISRIGLNIIIVVSLIITGLAIINYPLFPWWRPLRFLNIGYFPSVIISGIGILAFLTALFYQFSVNYLKILDSDLRKHRWKYFPILFLLFLAPGLIIQPLYNGLLENWSAIIGFILLAMALASYVIFAIKHGKKGFVDKKFSVAIILFCQFAISILFFCPIFEYMISYRYSFSSVLFEVLSGFVLLLSFWGNGLILGGILAARSNLRRSKKRLLFIVPFIVAVLEIVAYAIFPNYVLFSIGSYLVYNWNIINIAALILNGIVFLLLLNKPLKIGLGRTIRISLTWSLPFIIGWLQSSLVNANSEIFLFEKWGTINFTPYFLFMVVLSALIRSLPLIVTLRVIRKAYEKRWGLTNRDQLAEN